jgi:thiamine biosynthesis lipoprotein
VEITVSHDDEKAAREAMELAFAEFERIDGLLSSYRPESDVSRLNEAGTGGSVLDAETVALLDAARRISELSGGAFDVTVGPFLSLWRLEEGGRLPSADELSAAAELVDYRFLEIDAGLSRVTPALAGMRVDLGAIGKGYAVDRAAGILRSAGIASAIIDAGGDIRLVGGKPGRGSWRIGIRHPREPGKLLLSLDLADRAVVTSGDYERFFTVNGVRYHHLLDPKTGLPARGCQSVTVIAGSTAEADALATAAFVMGAAKGLAFLREIEGVEGIIVDAEGSVSFTDRKTLGL